MGMIYIPNKSNKLTYSKLTKSNAWNKNKEPIKDSVQVKR